jgi:hypothetical protein
MKQGSERAQSQSISAGGAVQEKGLGAAIKNNGHGVIFRVGFQFLNGFDAKNHSGGDHRRSL